MKNKNTKQWLEIFYDSPGPEEERPDMRILHDGNGNFRFSAKPNIDATWEKDVKGQEAARYLMENVIPKALHRYLRIV